MNRRSFSQTLAGSLLGAYGVGHKPGRLLDPTLLAAGSDKTSAPFDVSVMLWTVFNSLPFEQRLEKVAEAGYRNVQLVGEYQEWTEKEFDRANAKRRELGLTFDCTAGLKHGVSVPDDRPTLLEELRQVLPVMEKIECPSIILLSGNKIPGMPREVQHQSCVDTLRAGAKVMEGKSINGQPVRLLLETIDPEENPKYFLTTIAEAINVVAEVNHPQVKLLYDFYHQQIAAGNLIENLEKSLPHLGLVHIADVPGRHEPGTGEVNYLNIYRKLAELNYTGKVAMEFRPSGDPVEKLRAAREEALQAGSRAFSFRALPA
jgi:hydroxypyruvate isomerase